MIRNRRIKLLLLFMALLLSLPAPPVAHASTKVEPTHVLIVYDSLVKGSSRQGNVEVLQRLLAAYGAKVTITGVDDYQPGTLRQYGKVIGVGNREDLEITNADYLQDLNTYEGDYLHIGEHPPKRVMDGLGIRLREAGQETIRLSMGPYAETTRETSNVPYIEQSVGERYGSISIDSSGVQAPYGVMDKHLAYVPYMAQGTLSELAMAYLLKDWLSIEGEGQTYLLFKEIYPFSDLSLLTHMADKLYDAGIPFIVSVRPVFGNTDYPAMKRYLEALKYVQAKNGSILVNAPVVASGIRERESALPGKMESFIDVLAQNGIVPLGLGADLYWSYDKLYAAEGMSFFDSTVLFANENKLYRDEADTSLPFLSSLYSMGEDYLRLITEAGKKVQSFPMNAALTFDFPEDEAGLDRIVDFLMNSWVDFADYKYESHQVKTDSNVMASQNGILYLNGRSVYLNDKLQDVSSDYLYKSHEPQRLKKLFNVQNNFFTVMISMTLLIFGIFFVVGSRRYRRKFYK
ncbi:hypothetical protein [Gorillibacterium massiliense]|uniref:hypothetical protein n=1 Tax=Gorillibacterium massiliense TaxID=1280390 RepID=UPI0004B2F728|nr:hypothetical protein [Gorillibacterium massiliense]